MRRAVYPGSFDPPTNGHVDIARRASYLVDELIVAVGVNVHKVSLFTSEERVQMLQESLVDLKNIKVMSYSGLLVDFLSTVQSSIIVRGLRNETDFASEMEMAQINSQLSPGVETIFLPAKDSQLFLSSSCVREVASLGGDVTSWVPEKVLHYLKNKL
ncbi:pantetheine-phosphate adenylyltransferase [bacterium]|nr:pantetheine-phosphate adenylyltransferase [bacterium]